MAATMNVWSSMLQTVKYSLQISIPRTIRSRPFSQTSAMCLKKIEVTVDEKKTVVEGVKMEDTTKNKVRNIKATTGCPLCEFQDSLTYRDVLILQQFLSPDGKILPRHVTGLCFTMHWKLQNILYQSYSAGLIPDYKPDLPIFEDPKTYEKSYKFRKNNVYYDDFSTENFL